MIRLLLGQRAGQELMDDSSQRATDRFAALHERLVLRHPILTLCVVAVIVAVFGWNAQYFSLDATADSLTLERDEDLSYYRLIRARYGSDDYLVATFAPVGDLFSEPVLQQIRGLRDNLLAVNGVDSVVSILDVPLIKSPPVDLRQMGEGLRRLDD
ncbi:MAG: hypothetical protein KJN77_05955, partial [Gammaproteobacteria bacterium]|nr:hypothetical protein [Gammaproteobacteria bacterium]